MKVKLEKVKAAENVFKKIFTYNGFDIRLAYRLLNFADAVNKELKKIEDLRVKLVMKYGEEKDGEFNVTPRNLPMFYEDIEKLLSEEVELPDIKFSLNDLEKVELNIEELTLIKDFLEEA